jgi:hypothetical protein
MVAMYRTVDLYSDHAMTPGLGALAVDAVNGPLKRTGIGGGR